MAMQTVQQLFLRELTMLYDAEIRILALLPIIAGEIYDSALKSALLEHRRETERHIQNLERCFRLLDHQPERTTCRAIKALIQEREGFVRRGMAPELLTLFDLGIILKIEHYETGHYRNMIEKATLMGEAECGRLLAHNLSQEEEMTRVIEYLGSHFQCQVFLTEPDLVSAPIPASKCA